MNNLARQLTQRPDLAKVDMTRAQAIMLATRSDGLVRKGKGQRLHAWVPLWKD